MIEIVKMIIINVLSAIYEQAVFAFVMAVLFMFLYMFAKEQGWKRSVQRWLAQFKNSEDFRRTFILALYTIMILHKTLVNRSVWANPLENVIGVWGLYNVNGELTTEVLENLVLFIPFTIFLLWSFKEIIIGQLVGLFVTVWKSVKVVFLFSLTIEFLQLFLRLGTFQLSDLFYNTLGGLIGGLIYWCAYKLTHRKKEK